MNVKKQKKTKESQNLNVITLYILASVSLFEIGYYRESVTALTEESKLTADQMRTA